MFYEIILPSHLGQLVYNEQIQSNQGTTTQRIDVSTLPKGSYYLQLKTENEVITKNVLVVD